MRHLSCHCHVHVYFMAGSALEAAGMAPLSFLTAQQMDALQLLLACDHCDFIPDWLE